MGKDRHGFFSEVLGAQKDRHGFFSGLLGAQKDRHGYIVVETVGSFLLLVFLMMSILLLVNVVTLQARVHFALTQTANELAMYSYILEATGAAKHIQALDATASEVSAEISEFEDNLLGISEGLQELSFGDVHGHASAAASQVAAWTEDPEETFKRFVRYGLDAGKNVLADKLIEQLVQKYLVNGQTDGNTYLKNANVLGGMDDFSFDDSKFIDEKGDILIVANYKIAYRFGALPLPFQDLRVTQKVKTKAWLNGEGDGYFPR